MFATFAIAGAHQQWTIKSTLSFDLPTNKRPMPETHYHLSTHGRGVEIDHENIIPDHEKYHPR